MLLEAYSMSKLERNQWAESLRRHFVRVAKQHPKLTPKDIVDSLLFKYRVTLNVLSDEDLSYISDKLERGIIDTGIDPTRGVSIDSQRKGHLVLNRFLDAMKGADKGIAEGVFSVVFGRVFKISTDPHGILRALSGNKQLTMVADRLVKRLVKLGYRI